MILIIWFGLLTLSRGTGRRPRRVVYFLVNSAIGFLPLGVLALIRLRMCGYRLIYRVNDFGDVLLYLYDFLTYHFNFAYTPLLYRPLQLNPAALPFVLLCAGGLVYCLFSFPKQRIALIVAAGTFLTAGISGVMPLGGVRHSFTVAPFAYILAGYGLEALKKWGTVSVFGKNMFRISIPVLVLLMTGVFLCSRVRVYSGRKSTLQIDAVLKEAKKHGIKKIVGFRHTFEALKVWNSTTKDILVKEDIELRKYRAGTNESLEEKYLLVTYRHAFNPPFDSHMAWRADITSHNDEFGNVEVTPLKEEIGPLKPEPDIMVHQSIYYPINGCFIYLIEPSEQDRDQ